MILIASSPLTLIYRIEADLISHEEFEDSSLYSDSEAEASEASETDSDTDEDNNGLTKVKQYTGADSYGGFKAVVK